LFFGEVLFYGDHLVSAFLILLLHISQQRVQVVLVALTLLLLPNIEFLLGLRHPVLHDD